MRFKIMSFMKRVHESKKTVSNRIATTVLNAITATPIIFHSLEAEDCLGVEGAEDGLLVAVVRVAVGVWVDIVQGGYEGKGGIVPMIE